MKGRAPREIPPIEEYDRVFGIEARQDYDTIDAVEQRTGYALDRAKLEAAARVLACPVKAHPPNWQHGRVIYALTRAYLARRDGSPVVFLDIGTAKGFSALCLRWAAMDAGVDARIVSLDVIDPLARVARNGPADCDGLKTLAETLAPWPEASATTYRMESSIDWLPKSKDRIHVAFVDGKHKYDVVRREGRMIAARQKPGDLVIFDDAQSDEIVRAVGELSALYAVDQIEAHAHRIYLVGVRR